MSHPNELIIYIDGKSVACTDTLKLPLSPRQSTEPITSKHEFTAKLDGSWVFDGGLEATVTLVYLHTTDSQMHFVTQDYQTEILIPVQEGCETLKKGDLIKLKAITE